MKDPNLYNINQLRGLNAEPLANSQEDDPFKLALDASIQEQVDLLLQEQDPSISQLLPREARRKKLEKEVRESLDFSELEKQIVLAVKILETEGHRYLTHDEHSSLLENLDQLRHQLDAIQFSDVNDESLRKAYAIPAKGLESILKIAIEKFNKEELLNSQAIFTFLSTLNPYDADYAYRLGIVAQKNEQYKTALQAYNAALSLDPQLIGAHLYAALCHIKCERKDEASKEVELAKEMMKRIEVNEDWHQLLAYIERMLGESKV